VFTYLLTPSAHFSHLEVEIHALPQVCLLRVTLIFPHEEAQCIVSVSRLSLRQEHRVVETQLLPTSQSLQRDITCPKDWSILL